MTRVLSVLLTIGIASITLAAQAPAERRVYVALTDARGAPISSATVPDFSIRIDGHEATVLSAVPATEALSLVLLTEGLVTQLTPEVRRTMRAVVASVREHNPASRVGLMLTQGPAAPRMHGVMDGEAELEKEISHFTGGQQTAPLLEGILVATRTLATEKSLRRIIVAVAAGEESNHGVAAPGRVLRELQGSGVALWALDFGWGARALGPSEERILSQATRSSGGKREFSTSKSMEIMVARMLDVIRSQYLVTYRLPDSATGKSTLRVGVSREQALVLAPTWVSGR